MTFKFHFTVKGPASPISSLRSGQYIVLRSIQQRVGYGRRRLRRRARASARKRLTPPPLQGRYWGRADDAMGRCPGTKAELSRKNTRSGPDSGTKTESSHESSPKTRASEVVPKWPQHKTPGQDVPYRESFRPFPRLPWDDSLFVPESSPHAALRAAAQALRLPRCYHANRCVRIKSLYKANRPTPASSSHQSKCPIDYSTRAGEARRKQSVSPSH